MNQTSPELGEIQIHHGKGQLLTYWPIEKHCKKQSNHWKYSWGQTCVGCKNHVLDWGTH